MPKAEAGTPKALANKMKAKGLQRLRWYCQVCERQMRDENGFKQHTMSEAHVRNMQLVGDNAKSFIDDYSNNFKRDFIQLLRTGHGEKYVHANHFYQEYIGNKEHVHMNATKWPSLTEFVKYLGREKIVRVEEEEKGLFISWIDDSPEALRRNEAVQRKERQDKGDEYREQKLLREQIERARVRAKELERIQAERTENKDTQEENIETKSNEPIKFGFAAKKPETQPTDEKKPAEPKEDIGPGTDSKPDIPAAESAPMKISFGAAKPKNVFAEEKKKNPFKSKGTTVDQGPKKMSEAERIMREEMERKRKFSDRKDGGEGKKRIRL